MEISSISIAGITAGARKTLSFFDTSKFSNLTVWYSFIIPLYFAGISATFVTNAQSVNEQEISVMVCLSLSPSLLETTATINLQAQPVTANGIQLTYICTEKLYRLHIFLFR